MATDGISGTAVAGILAGAVVTYAAVKNTSVGETVKSFLAGNAPAPGGANASGFPPVTDSQSNIDATGGGSPTANRAIGRTMAAGYGWIGPQWEALDKLWTRESGWNQYAHNPSGAYGIPQSLPESKLPAAGQRAGGSNPAAQIAWGLKYIHDRYGDPIAAWAHEESAGWY
jgi:resuscitation-promoting factor RpfB